MTVRGKGDCFIGKYCAIGEGLRIVTSNHETGRANLQVRLQRRLGFRDVSGEPRTVRIGNACWIGDNVTFLPGSGLKDGCIAGAGAIVTKVFPPFSIVGGNPARVLRMRFAEEVVRVLLEMAWWEWSEERMARHRRFFDANLTEISDPDEIRALLED
jgi:virginiamycin A acetyltransferase